jgi:hypothetical protein
MAWICGSSLRSLSITGELREEIPIRTPLVGDEFNTTAAGIHVDGMLIRPGDL